MNLFFTIMTLVSLSFTVSGDREYVLASLRKSYNNIEEISKTYLDMLNEGQNEHNPCYYTAQTHSDLRIIRSILIVESAIIKGDFNDDTGFRIMLDDFTTVDVPVLLRCIPKYYNGSKILIHHREFIYSLILYKMNNEVKYELVYPSGETEDSRPLFLLGKATVIKDILKTYKTNYEEMKKIQKFLTSFKQEVNAGVKCEELVFGLGLTRNESEYKWEIINGVIEIGKFQLRITKEKQAKIPGVLICDVKFNPKAGENANAEIKKRKYFTISKLDPQIKTKEHLKYYTYAQNVFFVRIHGKPNKKITKFVLNPELL